MNENKNVVRTFVYYTEARRIQGGRGRINSRSMVQSRDIKFKLSRMQVDRFKEVKESSTPFKRRHH